MSTIAQTQKKITENKQQFQKVPGDDGSEAFSSSASYAANIHG
jgi:hypothetical protein